MSRDGMCRRGYPVETFDCRCHRFIRMLVHPSTFRSVQLAIVHSRVGDFKTGFRCIIFQDGCYHCVRRLSLT